MHAAGLDHAQDAAAKLLAAVRPGPEAGLAPEHGAAQGALGGVVGQRDVGGAQKGPEPRANASKSSVRSIP